MESSHRLDATGYRIESGRSLITQIHALGADISLRAAPTPAKLPKPSVSYSAIRLRRSARLLSQRGV